LRPYILLVPAVGITVILLVWPIVSILRFSLYRHVPGLVYVPQWTLENYRDLLNPYFIKTLFRTIRFSLITCLICTVLGYPTAYFISRVGARYKSLLIFLMVLPLLVGSVIRTYGWIILLSRDNFLALAIDRLPGDHSGGLLGTEPAVIAGLVDALLPFMILPLMSSINRIGAAIEDAATVLGARPWQVWLHVVLPMSIPGLVSGTLLVYILCMGALVAPLYLGGEGFQTLSTQIWSDMLTTLDWPAGSAIAVVLMAWIGVTSYIYLQLTNRIGYVAGRQR
jgi:ABC-type spermidine/putrescine transport system permease subunit I